MKYLLAALLLLISTQSVLGEEDEQLLYMCSVTQPGASTKELTDNYGEEIGKMSSPSFTFFIDKDTNNAVDLRDDVKSSRKGTLDISEFNYSLAFPSTEETDNVSGAWESAVVINRVTSEFKIEWGEPPFFKSREGNTHHEGLCKNSEVSTNVGETGSVSQKSRSRQGSEKHLWGAPRMGRVIRNQ